MYLYARQISVFLATVASIIERHKTSLAIEIDLLFGTYQLDQKLHTKIEPQSCDTAAPCNIPVV